MKRRKASARAVAAMVMEMSDEELLAMVDHGPEVRDFLANLVEKSAEGAFVTYMSDEELVEQFPQYADFIPKYRRLAADLGYSGPVAWRVRAGFTLKEHAPKSGPCYENFGYLRDWEFEDKPTRDCLVFWIPRLFPKSTAKDVDEQMELLSKTRERFELPEHHLSSLGSVALNTALILAEHKRSGDRVPLDRYYIRTDTRDSDGYRLRLGLFGGSGLDCGHWVWDDHRNDNLGCFALMV
jgi:hypothetical protein